MTDTDQNPKKRRRPIWHYALAVPVGLVGLAVILVVVAVLALQIPTVQNRVLMAATLAAEGAGLTVTYERARGLLPRSLEVSGLEIADENGVFFSADQVRLVWSPLALVTGTARVRVAALDAGRLERLPVLEASEGPAEPEAAPPGEPFAELPVRVVLDDVSIRSLFLGQAVTGTEDLVVSVEAEAKGAGDAL
ncbi:MAG: hypothetical protein AAGH45_03705, partial [Pseudomonadota bacterium]